MERKRNVYVQIHYFYIYQNRKDESRKILGLSCVCVAYVERKLCVLVYKFFVKKIDMINNVYFVFLPPQ